MTSGNSTPRAERSVALSVILGTLLVPLSAYAASALFDAGDAAKSLPNVERSVTGAPTVAADMGTACGEAGLAMVAVETAGTISELQQAALDALRGICAEQGIPLPAPELEPVVAGVTQSSPPPPAPASEQLVVTSDDDHGRHGGDDEDDHHSRHGGDADDDDHDGRHGDVDDDRPGKDHD